MRMLIGLLCLAFTIYSCEKGGSESAPKLEFSDLQPNYLSRAFLESLNQTTKNNASKLTLKLEDRDGDLGFLPGKDTSMIYLTYYTDNGDTSQLDSLDLPDLRVISGKSLKADLVINLYRTLVLSEICSNPGQDSLVSLFYQVYVKDFAGNKSNVIDTRNYNAPLVCSCK